MKVSSKSGFSDLLLSVFSHIQTNRNEIGIISTKQTTAKKWNIKKKEMLDLKHTTLKKKLVKIGQYSIYYVIKYIFLAFKFHSHPFFHVFIALSLPKKNKHFFYFHLKTDKSKWVLSKNVPSSHYFRHIFVWDDVILTDFLHVQGCWPEVF